MDEYLAKPIRSAELLAMLERLTKAPPPGKPAFDPEEVLARVEGDRTLLAELVDIFKVESPRLLTDLRRCIEANDAKGTEYAAHALKGSVGNFGAHAASDAALALELLGRGGDLTGAAGGLEALESEMERVSLGLVRMGEGASAAPAMVIK